MKFEFYLMSLWLLFALIVVIKIDFNIQHSPIEFKNWVSAFSEKNTFALTAIIFILLGALSYFRFKFRIDSSSSLPVTLTEAEDLNYEHLTFLTTYIVPLICFNLDSSRYVISLFLLLFVIGLIYIKTDKFYANPTLAVLGFRLYKINYGDGEKILITKSRVSEKDRLTFVRLDDKFLFGRKV